MGSIIKFSRKKKELPLAYETIVQNQIIFLIIIQIRRQLGLAQVIGKYGC